MYLLLGKGLSNNGIENILKQNNLEYEYLNLNEVKKYDYECVIKAPGIPYTNNIIKEFINKNVKIVTDIEFVMNMYPLKYYILVSGSNGKSTTSSIIYHILKNENDCVLCGNIGYSIGDAITENPNINLFIVEVSSFQLEYVNINPNISVLTNVNPCHLDHHISFRNYVDSKSNITINQSSNNYLIFYNNDVLLKQISLKTKAIKVSFDNNSVLSKCYIYNSYIYFDNHKIYKINLKIKDKEYLILDMMAAICTAVCYGIKPSKIRKYIRDFNELEYRLTKVNDYIYNDSKSTNPYSSIASIKCLDNIILICGGYDRKEDLSCLKDYLYKIKKVFTYGESKNKVYNFMNSNNVEVDVCLNLKEAFMKAIKVRNNEIILFSPMFASYDQFKNFVDRGKYFDDLCKQTVIN